MAGRVIFAEEFPLKLNHAGYIPNLLRSPVVFRGFTTRIFTSVVGGSELNLHLPTNYHSKSYPFLFGHLEEAPHFTPSIIGFWAHLVVMTVVLIFRGSHPTRKRRGLNLLGLPANRRSRSPASLFGPSRSR